MATWAELMIEGHVFGPSCPCSKTLLADDHPHRCGCGGYYHLVCEQGIGTEIVCDVCGKDKEPYPETEMRL